MSCNIYLIYEKFSDHLCFTMKNLYLVAILATLTTLLTNGEAAVPTACPGINGRLTTQISDPKSCTKFYKCDMGRKTLIECPYYKDGETSFQLCFNPELELCDWPWNVTCCSKNVIPGTGPGADSTTTTTTKAPPSGKPFECEPGKSYKAPFEGRCDLYHICINGKDTVTSCLENHYFNPKTSECDLAANVPNCP